MRFAVCRCLRWLVRSSFQDPIDDSRERTQLWPPRRRASAIPWRHRERQHLTDRLAVYTKHPRGLAGAHPLDMTRPPNPCVQLHPIHPPRLPVRATLTEGYTRSHFGPPQPDRPAASVGDYCSAVLNQVVAVQVGQHQGVDVTPGEAGLDQPMGDPGAAVDQHMAAAMADHLGRAVAPGVDYRTAGAEQSEAHFIKARSSAQPCMHTTGAPAKRLAAPSRGLEDALGSRQKSRKERSLRERLGCLSLRRALASIWRMRSRVTENC